MATPFKGSQPTSLPTGGIPHPPTGESSQLKEEIVRQLLGNQTSVGTAAPLSGKGSSVVPGSMPSLNWGNFVVTQDVIDDAVAKEKAATPPGPTIRVWAVSKDCMIDFDRVVAITIADEEIIEFVVNVDVDDQGTRIIPVSIEHLLPGFRKWLTEQGIDLGIYTRER